MAKKKENLEERLKKAARNEGKKPEEPGLKVPSKVADERAEIGKVKLRRPSRATQEPIVRTETPFGPLNWWLLAGGVILAAVGFVFLYFGDTIISTTLLVLGYCVVIPVALLISPNVLKRKPKEEIVAPEKTDSASKPGAQPGSAVQPEPEARPEVSEGGKKEGETKG
ncbi:MAG: hypothetical protein ACP5QG_02165 [candidate division WOR-3 bacterium]